MESRVDISRPIFLFGLQRSGTTLAWNFLQSQPETLWPKAEMHKVLRPTRDWQHHKKDLVATTLSYLPVVLQSGDFLRIHAAPKPDRLMRHADWFQQGLEKAVRQNKAQRAAFRAGLGHGEAPENRLLVKVMNYGIAFAPDLARIYPDATFVVVTRDLTAVMEGHLTRGRDFEQVAQLCDDYTRYCQHFTETGCPTHVFRFEDYLADPVATALALLSGTGFNCTHDDLVSIQDRRRSKPLRDGRILSESVRLCLPINDLGQHVRTDANASAFERLGPDLTCRIKDRLQTAMARQDAFNMSNP